MTTERPVLLISFGDLPSLVALALESQPQRVILWHPLTTGPNGPRRLAAVRRQADAFGVRDIMELELPTGGGPRGTIAGADDAVLLACAARDALERGGRRMVWPCVAGPEFESLGPQVERATLAAELVSVGTTGAFEIDLPVADLSDEQVVDVADDVAAPLETFWPCEQGPSEPCGACRSCRRWGAGFRARGIRWPWEAEVAAPV